MEITAAVARAPHADFELEQLELDEPRAGEVLVRIVGAGVCHTDLLARDQDYPAPLPIVLGHEGAGVVEQVGPGVTKVEPGDHVALTFMSCGACDNCVSGISMHCEHNFGFQFGGTRPDGSLPIAKGEERIHGSFFGQSSFATHALAYERNVVKVSQDAPLELLGPLGCGIQTGAGTILNALRPPAGSGVAVFGAGAVGLSAVLGAVLCGANPIIAVDLNRDRLELAQDLGATEVIDAGGGDVVEQLLELTGGRGIRYAVEATGLPAVLRQAVDALASPGTCAVVGAAPLGTEVSLDMSTLLAGRQVIGVIEGYSVPDVFIPRLVALHAAGRFPFDRMVKRYPLAGINQAVADSLDGTAIKPVLVPDL